MSDNITGSNSQKKQTCEHCQLPLPKNQTITAEINGEIKNFCCHGCKTVCEMIYSSGMEGFYQRMAFQNEGEATLQPPPEINSDLQIYDLDEIQNDYITRYGDDKEIHLLIEGIHCAACVWLIEHRLSQVAGVVQANVNLSARKLRLRWNDTKIKLSEILLILAQIGYAGVPFDPEAAEGQIKKNNRKLLLRLGFAGFAAMNLMWISIALYTGADEGKYKILFHWLGFALSTPTLFYSGYPFFKGAVTGLVNKHLTMDLPIAIGASITYLYSCYVVFNGSEVGEVYFDTVVNFLFVILTGRYLEAMSKRMAVQSSQRLLDLQPKIATRINANGEQEVIPVRALHKDDIVLVKAGDKIPVDGIVVKGASIIDESMLTGEFIPVKKSEGDHVSAGTSNKDGVLHLQVQTTLKNTALGKIIHLVDEAQSTKAPIQCTTDKIIPWFVSITLLLSIITFTYWVSIDFELALMAATSVLIITCPCAFGLATPMAIAVATGVGASKGVLVKHGEILEILSKIKHFIFDKTGTLTIGKMTITGMFLHENKKSNSPIKLAFNELEQLPEIAIKLLSLAESLEKNSSHMIARSIVNYVAELKLPRLNDLNTDNSFQKIQEISGCGIQSIYNQQKIAIGKLEWIAKLAGLTSAEVKSYQKLFEQQIVHGSTIVYLWLENEAILSIIIEDKIRENAKQVIEQMTENGLEVTLLSGDKQTAAEYMAEQLNIKQVIAEVMPSEKDSHIQSIQEKGQKVAMIGDGINDAPALVRADVGIAMGTGTDVSIDSADMILVNGELEKIPLAAQLSQSTLRTIKQNIGISIIYNIIMVPLAMSAMITPVIAAISMPISSLLVIGNAARLRWKFRK